MVATAAERGEGEEDPDPCRPEGSISFVVRNFSELESTVLSEPTLIRNLPWCVQPVEGASECVCVCVCVCVRVL